MVLYSRARQSTRWRTPWPVSSRSVSMGTSALPRGVGNIELLGHDALEVRQHGLAPRTLVRRTGPDATNQLFVAPHETRALGRAGLRERGSVFQKAGQPLPFAAQVQLLGFELAGHDGDHVGSHARVKALNAVE